jgi:hypothetical protein
VFGRELRLPYDLLFRAPPDKERPTVDHAENLVDHLQDNHNYARQRLKLASDRVKSRHDGLANCACYHEGDAVWLYRRTRTKGKSLKLQPLWEGPYRVVTGINVAVYRIQRNSRSRRMVVQLDRLAPYQGTARDERLQGGSSGSSWRVIAVRNEPRERKTRPIEDVTSTALGKKEMAVRL